MYTGFWITMNNSLGIKRAKLSKTMGLNNMVTSINIISKQKHYTYKNYYYYYPNPIAKDNGMFINTSI